MTMIEETLSEIARMRAVRKHPMQPSNAMQDLQSGLAHMTIAQSGNKISESQGDPASQQKIRPQPLSWKEMQYQILGLNHLLSLIRDDLSALSAKTFIDILRSERADGTKAQNDMERNRLEEKITGNLEHATKVLEYVFATPIPRREHTISLEALKESIIEKAEDFVYVLQKFQEAAWVVQNYEATQTTCDCEISRSHDHLPEIESDSALTCQLEDMRL